MAEDIHGNVVRVTLCGVKQAELGFRFIHLGPAQVCEKCKLFHVCMGNLEAGRVYKIMKVRDKAFACKLHEGGVKVVEVKEAEISGVVNVGMAIEGALVTVYPQNCGRRGCENFSVCNPEGLVPGDKYKIITVNGRTSCPEGRTLLTVSMLRKLM